MGHTVGELQWKDPDFLCISVFSVAVMEKCCDACGDGEYYFRSAFSTSQGDDVCWASSAVDRKSRGHTVGELQWKDPDFLCISVFSVAVMEKCCDACGDGEYYFRFGFFDVTGCRYIRGIECR
jgi:hypothetical protein